MFVLRAGELTVSVPAVASRETPSDPYKFDVYSFQTGAYLARGVSLTNAIHVIVPYRHASTWVFDDTRVGLLHEPFVSGIPEMIDALVSDLPNAERGFRLLFSAAHFPRFQVKLEKVRVEYDGAWYQWVDHRAGAVSRSPFLLSRSTGIHLCQS
jgi:hypothetical protein